MKIFGRELNKLERHRETKEVGEGKEGPVAMTGHLENTKSLDKKEKKLNASKELLKKEKIPKKRKKLKRQINKIDKNIEKEMKKIMKEMDKKEKAEEKDCFQGTEKERQELIKKATMEQLEKK